MVTSAECHKDQQGMSGLRNAAYHLSAATEGEKSKLIPCSNKGRSWKEWRRQRRQYANMARSTLPRSVVRSFCRSVDLNDRLIVDRFRIVPFYFTFVLEIRVVLVSGRSGRDKPSEPSKEEPPTAKRVGY